MQLTQALHKALIERPEALAIVSGEQRISYARFTDRVSRFAGALRQLGVRPGDRIALLAANRAESLEYFFATWWVGGMINPVNVRWSVAEIAYSLDDCDTRLLIVDELHAKMVPALRTVSKSLRTVVHIGRGLAPQGTLDYESLIDEGPAVQDCARRGDDLAAVMYTGGTTGRPKGVMLSHANLWLSMMGQIAAVPRSLRGVGLVVAPMFHVGGLGLVLIQILRLATVVVLPAFDERAVLDAMARHRVTEVFLVPAMIRRLLDHPGFAGFDLSSLELLLYGAAPIDSPLLERVIQALPKTALAQVYGMTELASTVTLLPPAFHRPGPGQARRLRSAGFPVLSAEVRVVDPDGRGVARGSVGEVLVRGPVVMQGYWNRPEETAQALRDGWMHTGDAGCIDEEGLLHIVDRIKDMIITGGENVYSAEVENALSTLPQVAMCAVIGVPDVQWGERVHAVLVLREGQTLSAAEAIAHCRSLIAGYKCPSSVEFRKEMPLSAAGKLQKFELRKAFLAQAGGATGA